MDMDKFELTMTLTEFGIDTPDRCKVCPHLGSLASKLSRAQENKNFLTTSVDEEVLTANICAQLTVRVKERFPGTTDEQVADIVDNSFANFLRSDQYTDALKQAGNILEEEDTTIALLLNEIASLVEGCPPEGCSTN